MVIDASETEILEWTSSKHLRQLRVRGVSRHLAASHLCEQIIEQFV